MTINPMYARMGLSIAEGATGFLNQGIAASLQASLQKYRNQMLQISAAMANNAVTHNEISTRDASTRLNFAIQQQAAADQGSAEVAAAAAGVQGGSVDATMRGLRRSAANAQAARQMRAKAEAQAHHQERKNNNISAIFGRDTTPIDRPSLLSSAVGLGTTLLDNYDDYQPEGDKLGDQLKAWWGS